MPTSSQALQQLRASETGGVGTNREHLGIDLLQTEENIWKADHPPAPLTPRSNQILPAIGSAHAQTSQVISALTQASKQRSENKKSRGIFHRKRGQIIDILTGQQAVTVDKVNVNTGNQNQIQHHGDAYLTADTDSSTRMTNQGFTFTKRSRSIPHNLLTGENSNTKMVHPSRGSRSNNTITPVFSDGLKPAAVPVHPPRLPGFYGKGVQQSRHCHTSHSTRGRDTFQSVSGLDADGLHRHGDGDNVVHLLESKQEVSGDDASGLMQELQPFSGGACGVLTVNKDTGRHEWKLLSSCREAFTTNAGFKGDTKQISPSTTGKQALPYGLWVSPYEKMERQREERQKIKFRSLPSIFDLQLRAGKGVGVTGMLDINGKHIHLPGAGRLSHPEATERLQGQSVDDEQGDPDPCPPVLDSTSQGSWKGDLYSHTESCTCEQDTDAGSCFNLQVCVSGRGIQHRPTTPTSLITPRITVQTASPEGLSQEDSVNDTCITISRDGNSKKFEALTGWRSFREDNAREVDQVEGTRNDQMEDCSNQHREKSQEVERKEHSLYFKETRDISEAFYNEDEENPAPMDTLFQRQLSGRVDGKVIFDSECADMGNSMDINCIRRSCHEHGQWEKCGQQQATPTQLLVNQTHTVDSETESENESRGKPFTAVELLRLRSLKDSERLAEVHKDDDEEDDDDDDGSSACGFNNSPNKPNSPYRGLRQPEVQNLIFTDLNRRTTAEAEKNLEASENCQFERKQSTNRPGYIKHLAVPDAFPKAEARSSSPHSSSGDVPGEVPISEAFSGSRLLRRFNSSVLRMRKELPPSNPKKLCFQSNIPGCTHAEILQCLEAAFPEVKVASLQYDPVYLQDYREPSNAVRFKCMWLFTLGSGSDPDSLLSRGFRLRGQRMNIRRADDVYAEEQRTFKMCWEMLRRGLVAIRGFKGQSVTELKQQKDGKDSSTDNNSSADVYRTAERNPIPSKETNRRPLSKKCKDATSLTQISRQKFRDLNLVNQAFCETLPLCLKRPLKYYTSYTSKLNPTRREKSKSGLSDRKILINASFNSYSREIL